MKDFWHFVFIGGFVLISTGFAIGIFYLIIDVILGYHIGLIWSTVVGLSISWVLGAGAEGYKFLKKKYLVNYLLTKLGYNIDKEKG